MFVHFEKPKTRDELEDPTTYKNINLSAIMSNVESIQYKYDSFRDAYENNQEIQDLVSNFNGEGIFIDPEDNDLDSEETQEPEDSEDDVEDMAQNATDLSDN